MIDRKIGSLAKSDLDAIDRELRRTLDLYLANCPIIPETTPPRRTDAGSNLCSSRSIARSEGLTENR